MSAARSRRSASVPLTREAPIGNAGGGAAEGSPSSTPENDGQTLRTLRDVMGAPSSTLPDVVVIKSVPDGVDTKEVLDPKEDLWLTTADGRYSCPIVPLHVGQPPDRATFYVHRDILIRYDYFRMALCGPYLESNSQSLSFPDEDPGIFHFLVAYVYEGRYDPLQPIASVLVPETDKGKGKDTNSSSLDDSSSDDSETSLGSDVSAQYHRHREQRRRRTDRHFERMRQKHPGAHRPNCGCPTCQHANGPPCWACSAPRTRPPPPPARPPPGAVILRNEDPAVHRDRQRAARPVGARRQHNYPPPPLQGPLPPPPLPPPPPPPPPGAWRMPEARIFGEDLRTWLLAYELNIDVYVMANKYLMEGFKREVAKATIDMLETAGPDAAVPEVLQLCSKLRHGLPESDALLKMVFARVGFLQSLLWRKEPDSTEAFLHENPEVAAIMLRETIVRREEDYGGRRLPSMERPWSPPYETVGGPGGGGHGYRMGAPYPNQAARPRW